MEDGGRQSAGGTLPAGWTLPPALSRSGVDRAAHRRHDPDWLAAAWADPQARVLVVDPERRVLVDGTELVLLPTAQAPAHGERFLLGVDEADRPYWAVTAAEPLRRPGLRPAGLREVGALLGDRDAGLLTQAVALANWHATHPRCPRCGAPTRAEQAGYVRRCEADGSEHFPRTDPAVIMLVHDGAGRALLARSARWAPAFYSTLAGFVEPGESAEQAVRREVAEEVGLALADLRYEASQPWPFPASLMLGFTATAAPGGEVALADGELADARWLTRDEVRDGAVRLPPPVSIARRLIDAWLQGAE